ncbi:MAG: matrixin family metalloprotease [Phycisphaerae bacterium]
MNFDVATVTDYIRRRCGFHVARCLALACAFAGVATGGCITAVGSLGSAADTTDEDPNDQITDDIDKASEEPNDSFDEATPALFVAGGVAHLAGVVSVVHDLDVFLLGALSPGDRLTVDADTTGSSLDVMVGVFDAQHRLVAANDDRLFPDLDSYVELIVRHPGDSYYLVVTDSAFASIGRHTGSYSVDVTVEGGHEVPVPVEQLVMLDFDGGMVDSPVLGKTTIVPFDAAAIAPTYAGQTEALKEQIQAVFSQNFQRFNVAVRTTDSPPFPAGTEYSTVYFGGFSRDAFGQAENVDLYNADFCDDAIIFTESFSSDLFTFTPTIAELGVAIGNVAAHEAGHLLGLNHVNDDRALMDDQSPADVFITDQEFMEAALSSDLMAIGTQDAVLLLSETVGLSQQGLLGRPGTLASTGHPSSRKYFSGR